jgi:hypothetical protein
MSTSQARRIDHLETVIHPEPAADLTRLTEDERAQLEAVLRYVPEDGDLAVLSDDELDLLKELQRRAWVY